MTYSPATLISVITALLVSSCTAVGLRCWVRAHLVRNFGWNDWLMVIALVAYTSLSGVIYAEVYHGLGGQHEMLSHKQINKLYKIINISRCIYFVTTAFVKASIGLLLLRICGGRPKYRALVYGCIALAAAGALVCLITAPVECVPYGFVHSDKCLSPQVLLDIWYMFSSVNLAVDWTFALLPIPLLWDVQLPKRVKTSLMIILGMGILASASRILVLVELVKSSTARDRLDSYCKAIIWACIESSVAIVASSLATLRPLIRIISHAASRRTSALTATAKSVSTAKSHFDKGEVEVELKPYHHPQVLGFHRNEETASTVNLTHQDPSLEHAYSAQTCNILDSYEEGHYCHGVP